MGLKQTLLLDYENKKFMGYKKSHFFDQMISWHVGLTSCFFILICPFVLKADRLELTDPLNIRTCDIVSSSEELKGGVLSDYWAQELIGVDLLREELETVPTPEKDDFIFVLDSPCMVIMAFMLVI